MRSRRSKSRNAPPPRTNRSSLSDDELLILDFLFDKQSKAEHLDASIYAVHMDCGYTHGLGAEQLDQSIKSLVARGMLASRNRRGWEGVLCLTKAGGSAWESERCPDWSLYLWHSATVQESGNLLTIESPSFATLSRFVPAAREMGLFSPGDAAVREARPFWLRLMGRCFSFSTRFAVSLAASYGRCDYDALRRRCRWWDHVCDIPR